MVLSRGDRHTSLNGSKDDRIQDDKELLSVVFTLGEPSRTDVEDERDNPETQGFCTRKHGSRSAKYTRDTRVVREKLTGCDRGKVVNKTRTTSANKVEMLSK